MGILLATLKKILFWSYDRGSWQYDILCVLILAFIFFGPNSVFHNHRSSMADSSKADSIFISRQRPKRLGECAVDGRCGALHGATARPRAGWRAGATSVRRLYRRTGPAQAAAISPRGCVG